MRLIQIIIWGIISLLFVAAGIAQPSPVDCETAILVCSSQQLDYNSNGPGDNDFTGNNANSNGCLLNGEHQSAWFQIFISPSSPPGATLAFTITPDAGSGEDYDFALYGPNVDCGDLGLPIRCSYAAQSCGFCPETGLGMGTTDFSEGAGGDGFVAELETQPGESYILLVDNWLASSQGFFLDWTGTAILSCDCTTEVSIDGNLEICPGESTELTVNGTNLTEYEWEASNGGTISGPTNTETITATSPGTYSVTVTDIDTCIGEASVEVTVAPGPEIESEVVPTTCGQSNGAIDVTIGGSGTPFTFEWSNGETTEDLQDIEAGSYSVTVTGDNGCTSTASITVEDENPPIEISGTIEANTSCDGGNGSISISIAPSGTYDIQWSDGSSTEEIISDLIGGSYTVTVTSNGNCTETATFTVPDEPDLPELSATSESTTCDLPNGSINLSVNGGVPPYTYFWSTGETTEDITDLPAGEYTVTVSGDNGCTAELTIALSNENPPIEIEASIEPNTSCDAGNGSISLNVTPFDPDYTYTWNTGETTSDISDLDGGSYTLTVSGAGSCSAEATFTVPDEPDIPQLSAETNPASCDLPNGSIDLSVGGNTAPYIYEWSNGESTEDLEDITAGTYTVTVTGDNGCSALLTVSLANENPQITIDPDIEPNTTCAGGNGSISISITPPGNYTINWSTGASGQIIEDLAPGIYNVTVDGEGSCDQTASFTVPNQPNVPDISFDVSAATCGQSDGSIDLTVSGGGDPYEYLWSNGSTSEDLVDIPAGTYTVTVTGSNACTDVVTVEVPDDQISFTIIPDITPNTNCSSAGYNGGISLTVDPGGSYTFEWSDGSSGPALTDVAPGNYSVTVSAGGSCTETVTLSIPDEPVLPQLAEVVMPSSCSLPNGSIDLIVSGGTGPFDFQWSDGSTSEDVTDLSAGTYSVTVTGSNGCSSTSSIAVPNNDPAIVISGDVAPNTSCVSPNGAVNIDVSPPADYNFAWSSGQTTEDLLNLEAGIYTLTVTRGTCVATVSFEVLQAVQEAEITADIEAATCGESNASIDLTVTGGTPPYEYVWSNGASTQDLNDILPGIYSVTMTDANGCTTESAFQVQNNSSGFDISGTTGNVTSCLYDNGSIDLSVIPSGSYQITWSNGATSEDLDSLSPGDYSVTVTQTGDCAASAFFTIEDATNAPSVSGDISPEYCGQGDGSISLSVSGGTFPYSYSWSNEETTAGIDSLSTGSYTVTVSGANACSTTAFFTVPEQNVTFSITGSTAPDTSCAEPSGSIDVQINPGGTYAYLWSTGDTTRDLSGLVEGSYTLTVSAGGDCFSSRTFVVGSDQPDILIDGSVTDVLCHGSSDGSIDVSVSGGMTPYSYEWNPAVSGDPASPTGLEAGMYELTVTDQSGCTTSAEFIVSQPADSMDVRCMTLSDASQPGAADGIGGVEISGGSPPYTVYWTSGNSEAGVGTGVFEMENLGEGTYQVTVSDANGCTATCGYTVAVDECETSVGDMEDEMLTLCGPGCLKAAYDTAGQDLGDDGLLQFILHRGSGSVLFDPLARSDEARFCFDSTSMTFGEIYYISAVVGKDDGTGNVLLTDVCTKVAAGTPIVFNTIPDASIDPPDPLTCATEEVSLMGSTSLSGASFQWSTVDGFIIGDPGQQLIQAGASGTYVLEVSINGCSTTASVEVLDLSREIEAKIEANPGNAIDCIIATISLTGSANGTSDPLFEWYYEGTFVSNEATISTETPGLYELVVTDAQTLCSDSDSLVVEDHTDYPQLYVDPPEGINCVQTEVILSGGSVNSDIALHWATIMGSDTTVIGMGASVSVSTGGTYYLFGRAPNGCENAISVDVEEQNEIPPVDGGADVTLDCQGSPVDLSATAPEGVAYEWTGPMGGFLSDPSMQAVTVHLEGTYIITVHDPDNFCTNTDTVEVYQYDRVPRAEIIARPPACHGDQNGSITIQSDPGDGPYRYVLNGVDYGDDPTIESLAPGIYALEVTDGQGCIWETEVELSEPDELTVSLGENLVVEEGEYVSVSLDLSMPETALDTIIWSPDQILSCEQMPCLVQEFSPIEETLIRATVVDTNGCRASDVISVFVRKTHKVYVPNVFSPNKDGTNDVFMIYGGDDVVEVEEFVIFDRWGTRVFERRNFGLNDPSYGWDGTYRSEPMDPAVFVWYAVLSFEDGTDIQLKGDVTLRR